ncbi:MAG: hypothetical protein K8R59_06970 [Thermoanaerobaculales bacterium]|nr:hypothetical protein [Thermoanaerobaculales bacterium]
MKFVDLLSTVADEPIFSTGLLLSGDVDPGDVRRQLSRWTQDGRIHRLRRGVYTLAPPYAKVMAHPFSIANELVQPSYVSLQSALAFWGLIPETVLTTTSITTGRPGGFSTPLGVHVYRHVQKTWFHDYRRVDIGHGQFAWLASPEKALLDLFYLEKASDSRDFLRELRLELDDGIDLVRLRNLAEVCGQPKVRRAIGRLIKMKGQETEALEIT